MTWHQWWADLALEAGWNAALWPLLFPTPTGVVVVAATVTILATRITRLISRNGHVLAFDNLSGRQPWLGYPLLHILPPLAVASRGLTSRSGPQKPRAFAGRLRRAPSSARFEIVFGREGRLGMRTIRITAMGETQSHNTISTVSSVSDNGEGADLNHPRAGPEQAL
jgi:hypothetical protein